VQIVRQFGGVGQVFLVVVKTAAVGSPHFAEHAALFVFLGLGRMQAVVQHDEVNRFAYPGNGGNDVQPAQQQVAILKNEGLHQLPL